MKDSVRQHTIFRMGAAFCFSNSLLLTKQNRGIRICPFIQTSRTVTIPSRKPFVRRILPRAKTPPPQVKSSFYKNPSKAIEKGGGFFIPGLRGPRLRYFLTVVAGTLFTLNHLAAGSVQSLTFRTSEVMASLSILGVLATAVADTLDEKEEETRSNQSNVSGNEMDSSEPKEFSNSQAVPSKPSQWATDICTSLTSTTHIATFQNGISNAYGYNVSAGMEGGEAVRRVGEAQRALYVEDSSTLPPDVEFPFLPKGVWTLFIVPVTTSVVTVYATSKTSVDSGFSVEDRRWMQVFAERFVEGRGTSE